jgi:rifampin ADP-ribosylating transferase
MKIQYYVAATLDGYIATEDDSLDWLFPLGSTQESSYPEFIAEVGALAMGAATYEWVLRHADEVTAETGSPWPYTQPAWVFTHRSLPEVAGADIRFVRGDVNAVIDAMRAAAQGKNIWVVGGGELAGQFYDAGLLDELIIQVGSATLGRGKPLFPRQILSPVLRLVSVQQMGAGMAELRYQVNKTNTLAATHSQFYHGTRADLHPGDLITPDDASGAGGQDATAPAVYLTPNLDAAIWAAELADGDGPGRVYTVEPTGPVEDAPPQPGHPAMAHHSAAPLRVTGEVTAWRLYHGTRAALQPGDLIQPGQTPNFGNRDRTTTYVYFTRTLDAAIWGAELAAGDGPGRIYIVEPTGPVEDDPNLTDQRFRGNPTKSYRSREPLRVTGEVTAWQGHPPEAVKAMQEGLAKLEQLGVEPLDD